MEVCRELLPCEAELSFHERDNKSLGTRTNLNCKTTV